MSSPSQPRLSSRTMFAGAGTVGALAAAATVLPAVREAAPAPAQDPKPAPTRGGGYALTEHVQHYYRTTRI